MNRSVTVAILVSVLGFCVIVAICFLTYKLKPRHAELEPDDTLPNEYPNPSSLSFRPPATRRFVIRDGHAISASRTGTPSIRSGFSWNHRRYALHSERPSSADLDNRPRPPRKDVEKGIVDAVVESTLFMPQRSSIAAPSVLGRILSTVPEMSQTSPTRSLQTRRLSWDVRQLLDEVRTDTPLGHALQQPMSSATTGTARGSQIYELPATPVPPQSPETEPHPSDIPQHISSNSYTSIEPTTPTSPHSVSDPTLITQPVTPISPITVNTSLSLAQVTTASSPSTTCMSTPGRPSMDDATRALLRSKYNINGSGSDIEEPGTRYRPTRVMQ